MNRAALKARKWGAKGAHVAVLAAFVVFTAFPFYWMLITTFKETRDLVDTTNNPFLFNQPPTFEHIDKLFSETTFALWLGNTALVGLLVVVITLVLAVPVSVILSRADVGDWVRARRWLLIPEETEPPAELERLRVETAELDGRGVPFADGFVRAVVDPGMNAVHRALLREPRRLWRRNFVSTPLFLGWLVRERLARRS